MNQKRVTRHIRLLGVVALCLSQLPADAAAGIPRSKRIVQSARSSSSVSLDARAWRAPAAAKVNPKPCKSDPAFLCGSIRVPLDRADPSGEKIRIAFEILPRRNANSPQDDPVFITEGGPGGSPTSNHYFWAFVADAMNQKRDVVLIDARGTGKSGALRCGGLQNGWSSTEEFEADVSACGEKLGDAADRYGSGDIALDIEAVRKALGYDQINYVSSSYATVHAQAYAVRFPQNVRAIVADSAIYAADPDHFWQWGIEKPQSFVRAVSLACGRAPACAAAHPNAGELFADLVHRVAEEPIEGTALDYFGVPHDVVVDEGQVAAIVELNILNPGEIAAAAVALENGDPAPLLRLAAESPVSIGDEGDPRDFSVGANVATACNDQDMVWDRNQSIEQRRAAYAAALESFPDDVFAPFSVDAWPDYYFSTFCITWPAPDRFEPAVPAGATVPDVPVLLLTGDIDTVVPSEHVEKLTAFYENSTVVHVAGAPHDAFAWGPCPNGIATTFINRLDPGDTSCAEEPSFVGPAVPEFPLTAAATTPAESIPGSADESTEHDRRVAAAATKTVLDAWLRSFRQPIPVATGPGLRDGSFHANYGPNKATITLDKAMWVEDVSVTGKSVQSYSTQRTTATVSVRGSGTEPGKLHITGVWGFEFGSYLRITGTLGGRTIAVRIPTN
jgi:pimeloyl-ACP methyl ester carboxylesterase